MSFIPIQTFNLVQVAQSISVNVDNYELNQSITIKVSFYDQNNNFLLNKYVKLEGETYFNMVRSQNSDIFIKEYVENELGIVFLL